MSDDDQMTFHTGGPNCHWCYSRETAFVWGPHGTHICVVCQELIEAGRHWEVVEALAAKMTVRGGWHMLDPERWRTREHALMERWLAIRTTCLTVSRNSGVLERRVDPDPPPSAPDEPWDPDAI